MISPRGFPVMCPPDGCTSHVIWSSLHEDMAQKIHGQSLAQLARCGGLSPYDIVVNVRRLNITAVISDESAVAIINGIAQQ